MSDPAIAVDALTDRVDAEVAVPGSKSIANRALICASLADGASTVTGVPDGDDSSALLDALAVLGVGVGGGLDAIRIEPPAERWRRGVVDARLAGTTSRFLTALAALGGEPTTVTGEAPLRARPFGPLQDALVALGAAIESPAGHGHLPLVVSGPATGGAVELPGDISSQFVSALMMIGPTMPSGVQLRLTTPLVSRPYVEMTASVMLSFGATGVTVGDRLIDVPAGGYTGRRSRVEPDASSASYPLAIAAVTGGRVTVPGLGRRSLQGDVRIGELLERMGCSVEVDEDRITVTGAAELRGLDADMAHVSDLVPTIAVVAALATTPSTIGGVGFIRNKESDRLGDLSAELRRAGVRCGETADGLRIEPSRDRLRPARLATHHDHRLAMAFGVLGAAVGGITVEDPGVVSKTWPGYWAMLDSLR